MQGEKQYKTGLDVGSTTAKIVIIDESGKPFSLVMKDITPK